MAIVCRRLRCEQALGRGFKLTPTRNGRSLRTRSSGLIFAAAASELNEIRHDSNFLDTGFASW